MAIDRAQAIRIRILTEVLYDRFAASYESAFHNFNQDADAERELQHFERACATHLVLRREWQPDASREDGIWRIISDILLGRPDPKHARHGLTSEEVTAVYDLFSSL